MNEQAQNVLNHLDSNVTRWAKVLEERLERRAQRANRLLLSLREGAPTTSTNGVPSFGDLLNDDGADEALRELLQAKEVLWAASQVAKLASAESKA